MAIRWIRGLTASVGLGTALALGASSANGQTPNQPQVAPGPNEPDWDVVLRERYGLSMFGDLLNPVVTAAAETPGLFRKAGPGPVSYAPVIALGLETRNRGGWYRPNSDDAKPDRKSLWTYTFKNSDEDALSGRTLPELEPNAETEFDPGDEPFGLWVSNDGLDDGGVFSEPAIVARVNKRLADQPYKAMIYPNRDKATGRRIPNSYLIGWEYSTNDDFQDVVCQVDNVILIGEKEAGEPAR